MPNVSSFTYLYYTDFVDILSQDKYANISLNLQYGIYLDILIKFYCQPKIINKNPEYLSRDLNTTRDITNEILNKFCQTTTNDEGKLKYIRSPDLVIRCFYHILILALYLREFSTDMEPLCKSIKIDNKEMIGKLRLFNNCSFPQVKKEVGEDGKKQKKINKFICDMKAPLKLNLEPRKIR
jgi:hypothetical protein